jgi:hypothetical protein
MANVNLPRGLVPVRYISGAPYNGAANIYYVPSTYGTAIFRGDPVIQITNSADANGIPVVNVASAGGGTYVSGVMVGVVSAGDPMITVTADKPTYRVASTNAYILVADDPDLLFEVQEDSVGGNMAIGAAGRNVDLIAGTGSTVTGFSGWMADSSTLNTTNSLQLRVRRPVERADNSPLAADSRAKWLVSINLHSLKNLTGI